MPPSFILKAKVQSVFFFFFLLNAALMWHQSSDVTEQDERGGGVGEKIYLIIAGIRLLLKALCTIIPWIKADFVSGNTFHR